VGHLAPEGQAVPRLQHIGALPVPVFDFAFQHVDEFRARVLEGGEHLRFVVDGNEEGLEDLGGALVVGQQMVGVAPLGAPPHHLHALPFLHQLGAATGDVVMAEQGGKGDPQGMGQPGQGFQAGGGLGVFNLGQHAPADIGPVGHIRNGQAVLLAQIPDGAAQIAGQAIAAFVIAHGEISLFFRVLPACSGLCRNDEPIIPHHKVS